MLPPLKGIREILETDLFSASYVKLARAQHFIEELEAELTRYKNSEPLSCRLEHAEVPPSISVEWKAITLLPGAIIGDVIHNLRTSLDLMASELARINKKSDRDVYFPFATSADRFGDTIWSRNFDKAGDDAVALLRTLAPYRGGNELLRTLHDLDIQDKHTALVPTGHTITAHIEGSYNIDDLSQNTVALTGDNIHYVFPQGGLLAGAKVIETLKNLMEIVHGIVETFAGLVRSRPPAAKC